MCRRSPGVGLIERRDKHGVPYWLYLPEGQEKICLEPSKILVDRAPVPDLHLAYTTLLGWLGLSEQHRASLQERGLDEAVISRNGFRSWPSTRGEKRLLATRLYREFGEICRGLPGWFVQENKPMLTGGTGWVLPMWDLETGLVCALRMRSDQPDADPRYYWISSGGEKKGATSGAHARLAWPGRHPVRDDRADVVRITEGEIKAVVLAESTRVPTISAPGVASWRYAVPWLKWLGAKKVLICFDADFATNPTVARALLDAKMNLPGYGFTAKIETWEMR